MSLRGALTVEGVLGPGGALTAVLEGYEHRPEQLAVAREVERAFEDRSYLLAEAGTGTGKTLAYLIPAILSGRKVVISTATKTLQEQVFMKDLPLLRERLGLSFEAAYLKGRSNYLCLQRLSAFEQNPTFATPEEAQAFSQVRAWAQETQTGDRAELDLPDGYAAWQELSTTAERCLGQKCPLYESCFVTRMRQRAEAADVLLVNHHLFFADLALRTRGGRGGEGTGILPRYEAVVFDEAHALEDIATEFFGTQVSSWRLEELSSDAARALPQGESRHGVLCALSVTLSARAEAFFRSVPRAVGLAGRDGTVSLSAKSLAPLRGALAELHEGLAGLSAFAMSADEPALSAVGRRASELSHELEFLQAAASPDHVFWAESRGRGLFLHSAPIDVAKELQERLYRSVDTVVFTSATLTAGGSFDFFSRRMGLSPEVAPVREVAVASPFDYPRQAALYMPTHLPEPNEDGFLEALSEELVQLCYLTDGRAFALFTSLRNMLAVHQLTKNRLPYQLLLQGERPKSTLLSLFREEPSVLFASHSFWEGVDVPGDALSLVLMDRLPFSSPGDPLVAARIHQLTQRGENAFLAYQVPEAAISLRQGFGRLIRTREDRGIVAVMDRRLSTRSYGRVLLHSLPPARRFGERAALEAWFRSGPPARPRWAG